MITFFYGIIIVVELPIIMSSDTLKKLKDEFYEIYGKQVDYDIREDFSGKYWFELSISMNESEAEEKDENILIKMEEIVKKYFDTEIMGYLVK